MIIKNSETVAQFILFVDDNYFTLTLFPLLTMFVKWNSDFNETLLFNNQLNKIVNSLKIYSCSVVFAEDNYCGIQVFTCNMKSLWSVFFSAIKMLLLATTSLRQVM